MVAIFSLVPVSLLLATGSAIAIPQPATGSASGIGNLTFRSLSARQIDTGSNKLDQCKSQCDGLTKFEGCNEPQCDCTDEAADSLNSCLSCALSTDNTEANRNLLQVVLDQYQEQCKEAGFPVKSVKLNGALELRPTLLGISSLVALIATAAALL